MCHPARFRVVVCGRRWGKTELGKVALIDTARQGGHCWWIAPTYGMADAVWRSLKAALEGVWLAKDEQRRRVELPGGGVIQVRSSHEPDALRGAGLDLAVLDEAAFMPEEVWTGAIRPALSDRLGRALFLSTPNGMNWFQRLYQRGLDPLAADWQSFHHPTRSSLLIPPEEVDATRLEMPARWFRQEYEAEFIEDAGQVFREIDRLCTAQPSGPQPGARYVAGIDWGRVDDFTAFAVFDVEARRLVALDRFRQVSWAQQRDRLKTLVARWRPDVIWAEANSIGSVNIEALQQCGLPVRPFQTTSRSKGPLIEGLALAMERGDISLLDDPVLKGELVISYTLERLPSGLYRYGAASGAHDDTVIAVALGWHGVRHGGRGAVSFA